MLSCRCFYFEQSEKSKHTKLNHCMPYRPVYTGPHFNDCNQTWRAGGVCRKITQWRWMTRTGNGRFPTPAKKTGAHRQRATPSLRHTHHAHSSGHDYLDGERASCPMNTHWNTVSSNRHHRALSLFSSTACCASSLSISHSTFPGLGFESQSRQFFGFFPFSQFSATVNPWRIFFE